jgi:hypothetical protein
MTRTQSWLVVAGALLADVVLVCLIYYYAAAAPGHPHAKHMIGLFVLALLSLLVAWYALPRRAA